MGTIIPKMGTRKSKRKPRPQQGLADALFTRTQQKVLGLLFGQAERSFGTLELIGLAKAGRGTVQRELERLANAKLVTVTLIGAQKRYQANREAPIFDELRTIVEKTTGVSAAVRRALEPLSSRMQFAALFGSVAKGSETAVSDIDVLVVSDQLTLEELFGALEQAEQVLGRRVSPTLYTGKEFADRRSAGHPFLKNVIEGKHVVLIGSEDGAREAR
jgi:predicted nucleotidyltransferase